MYGKYLKKKFNVKFQQIDIMYDVWYKNLYTFEREVKFERRNIY